MQATIQDADTSLSIHAFFLMPVRYVTRERVSTQSWIARNVTSLLRSEWGVSVCAAKPAGANPRLRIVSARPSAAGRPLDAAAPRTRGLHLRDLRLDLSPLPPDRVRGAPEDPRGALAAQAPGDPPGRHLRGARPRSADAPARSGLGHAGGRGWPLRGIRLFVDRQARARADVRIADRPIRVDRAEERPPMARHARSAGRLRPGPGGP